MQQCCSCSCSSRMGMRQLYSLLFPRGGFLLCPFSEFFSEQREQCCMPLVWIALEKHTWLEDKVKPSKTFSYLPSFPSHAAGHMCLRMGSNAYVTTAAADGWEEPGSFAWFPQPREPFSQPQPHFNKAALSVVPNTWMRPLAVSSCVLQAFPPTTIGVPEKKIPCAGASEGFQRCVYI